MDPGWIVGQMTMVMLEIATANLDFVNIKVVFTLGFMPRTGGSFLKFGHFCPAAKRVVPGKESWLTGEESLVILHDINQTKHHLK